MHVPRVYANDIDANKIAIARHNSEIYKVDPSISFINKDFLLLDKAKDFLDPVDVVFISPPWGGTSYSKDQIYSLDMIKPNFREVVRKAISLADNVVLFLPRNTNVQQLTNILTSYESIFASNEHKETVVTVEALIYGGRNLRAIIVYIGPMFQVNPSYNSCSQKRRNSSRRSSQCSAPRSTPTRA